MRQKWIKNTTLINVDVIEGLRSLPDQSVHTVVTSPPYWGLRDYQVDGQLGLEKTPEEYVDKLVKIFQEIKRVLRDDGTAWLNLGDSYAGSGRAGNNHEYMEKHKMFGKAGYDHGIFGKPQPVPAGLKPKDLVGIPWRVAFALQADGWYLRSDIIWHKPNPLPESVTDRPTKSHEYIFLLSKSEHYFYNAEAIKENCKSGPSDIKKMIEKKDRIGGKNKTADDPLLKASALTKIGQKRSVGSPEGRNKRSVWTVATQPFPGAHFAIFPITLIEPCILAGCPPDGVILDPFAGSGTTAITAEMYKRKSIMIELSEKYFDMMCDRIRYGVVEKEKVEKVKKRVNMQLLSPEELE